MKSSGISDANRKLILNFVNYCFSEGIDEHRALKYLSILKIVSKSISVKRHDRKLPDDMLTQDEMQRIIDAAINKRDKAIIALLWDIGARIGEIGNFRIKDVKFDDIGISILVSGKTGQRRVRAVWSVDY